MLLSDPETKNSHPNLPWAIIIVTPDDPVAAISAAELIQFLNAPILFVEESGIPAVTLEESEWLSPVEALKRRQGNAAIYVMEGFQQISGTLVEKLSQYGSVARVTNDDKVVLNTPISPNPVTISVTFARLRDPTDLVS